jgi:hypothetical protein
MKMNHDRGEIGSEHHSSGTSPIEGGMDFGGPKWQ